MDKLNLPEGYSYKEETIDGKEFTYLYKEGKLILALPIEHCPLQRIEEVIKQTQGGNKIKKALGLT